MVGLDEKKNETAETCCCHGPQESKEETTHSCCSDSHQEVKKETAGSCCSHSHQETKKEPTHSCCSHSHQDVKEEASGSCCCHSHDHTVKEKKSNVSHGSGCGCCDVAPRKNTFWGKHKNKIILPVSFVTLIISFILSTIENDALHKGFWHYFDLGIIAVVLCGIPLIISAAKKLIFGKGFSGKVTSTLLVSTAIIACVTLEILMLTGLIKGDGHGHSYMFAAGEVAFLMCLGGVIEDFTVGKTRSKIESLVRLTPAKAKYLIDGVVIEKPLSEVRVGDIVTVFPDDMISVDGVVEDGATSVDESIMTGESVPVDKIAGDAVYGGTLNKGGAITVRVTKAEDAMAITKLKKLIEEAEGNKAPISRLAERVASFIVPSAIVLAFLIFGLNMLLLGKGIFAETPIMAIERGVTMLVVFCPCSLALATPTAVAAGLGNAAHNGILIKSGATLEELGRVQSVAFDKTGTLTEGAMFVDEIIPVEGVEKEYVARKTAAAESLSLHPIARAIAALYPLETAESVKSIAGFGVEATVGSDKITVTKYTPQKISPADGLTARENVLMPPAANLSARADELLAQGKTVVCVLQNDRQIGIIALSDKVRPASRECVEQLKDMGLSAYMLTGDNQSAARHIAAQAGIDEGFVFSSLLPEEKLRRIEELKARESVCMIGDGVNDAPALALANCSLAMGALGSDAAIEAASAALMTSDLKKVPLLLRLGRRVLRTIKFNIILSMTINVASVIMSTLGIINPAWGALIHNVSSVLVVLNSALLLRTK